MEKFLKHFCIFLGILMLLSQALLNYKIDPSNLYRSPENLKKLSKDTVLLIPENYNERTLFKKFVRISEKRKFLVIGSSRIMNLKLPGSFFNFGMTAATFEDYKEIVKILKKENKLPETMVLCLDPQSFGKVEKRWLSLHEQITYLFSRQTTWRSLQNLNKPKELYKVINRSEYFGDTAAKDESFSMLYPRSYSLRTREFIDASALANGDGEVSRFRNWTNLSVEMSAFDEIFKMKKLVKEFYVILMPYHPLALEKISKDKLALSNFQHFRFSLRRFCAIKNIGYFDGIVSGLKTDAFIDGIHLNAHSNMEFFKKAIEGIK